MEKSDTRWVPLVVIGFILLVLAGFDYNMTGFTTWPDYLDFGFLVGGVISLILAYEFRRRNKESMVEASDGRS